jgi:hypothetical protein
MTEINTERGEVVEVSAVDMSFAGITYVTGTTTRIGSRKRWWLGLIPWKTCTSYPLPAFLAHSA